MSLLSLLGWTLVAQLESLDAVAQENSPAKVIWNDAAATTEVGTGAIFFRKEFTIDKIEKSILKVSCDDGYRIYLNGRLIGSDKTWVNVERFDVTNALTVGDNSIAIQAENASPGPAGLFFEMSIGSGVRVVSDATTRWSSIPTAGWRFATFDDKAWKPAIELGNWRTTSPWAGQWTIEKKIQIVSQRVKRQRRDRLELFDGDRVVFLGGTFVERMQKEDYFETYLSSCFPNRKIVFRNLGWSGDNVFGLSRAVFGNQAQGFQRLENDLRLTNPTLVIVCYGRNESFAGSEGLPGFLAGLERLVSVVQSTGAEVVLLSPSYLENLGPPLPNPAETNQRIKMYSDAMHRWADKAKIPFLVNLKPLGDASVSKTDIPAIRDRLTDNGLHFNDYGYWRTAPHFGRKLGADLKPVQWSFDLGNQTFSAVGTTVQSVDFEEVLRFESIDDQMMQSPPPKGTPRGGDMMAIHDIIQVTGLPPGNYGLKMNGRPTIMASAERWEKGVLIHRGKFLSQSSSLRSAIQQKNELFFHRYRPQNETYLFLFRKHEQGNNAVEVPQFDPLIEQWETKIHQLKQPAKILYSLSRIPTPSKSVPKNGSEN